MPASWSGSLVAVALVSAVPMLAILLLALRAPAGHPAIARLVPFASGALLGAATLHLIPEAIARSGNEAKVLLLAALGIVAFGAVDRLMHARTNALVPAGPGGGLAPLPPVPARARELLPLTIAGDALHNLIDGMLIAAAFLDNPSLGIVTGAAVALHELPRELGTFAVLVAGGASMRQAILFNLATGGLAVGGAVLTLLLGTRISGTAATLVPFAAGNFLYLSLAIAWSESRRHPTRREQLAALALGLAGLVLTGVALRH
jgi:zinc and cadmium transporter